MSKLIPWIEKYRPRNFDDMVGHKEKIQTIKKMIGEKSMSHLLFYGPPGTGKTSLILATAREMYGKDYRMYILELNASDDRGIETVRNKIKYFVKTKSDKLRLVILDEADGMNNEAQSALKKIMDNYVKTSRFCLICNNFNKITEGIKSRCSIMRFGNLGRENIYLKIKQIAKIEELNIDDNAIKSLISIQPDLRQNLNILQSISYKNDNNICIIDEDIYKYLGIPSRDECKEIMDELFTLEFSEIYEKLLDLFKDNRWNILELIQYLAKELINRKEMPISQKFFLFEKLSEIEYRIILGRDSEIQLGCLVAACTFSSEEKVRQKELALTI